MNLNEKKHSKKTFGKKKVIMLLTMCCLLMTFSVTAFAAAKRHTTRPAMTVNNGRYNPFVHDNVKFYVDFCNKSGHAKKPNCSKVRANIEVKSSKRNTKVIKKKYDSLAKGAVQNAPAYTEYNNGKVCKLTIKSSVSDKYVTYGRYKTGDFYCVTCQATSDNDSYEKYCNKKFCKWVKEK